MGLGWSLMELNDTTYYDGMVIECLSFHFIQYSPSLQFGGMGLNQYFSFHHASIQIMTW